jgi:hypothetical protein
LKANVDPRIGNLQRFHESCFANFDTFEEIFSRHFPATTLLVFRVATLLWNLIDARVEKGTSTLVASNAPEQVEDLPASLEWKFVGVGAAFGTSAYERFVKLFWLHFPAFGIYVSFVSVSSLLPNFTSLVGNYASSAFWLNGI